MENYIYPVEEENAYTDWTPPPHDCYFLDDNGVEVGALNEQGEMIIYLLRRCNQCDNTETIPTDKPYNPPR